MKKYFRLTLLIAIFSILAGCTVKQDKGVVFYVSKSGNDYWSGKIPKPNNIKSNGPFATLEKARDAIRALKSKGTLPEGGATVNIREGTYPILYTFKLTTKDSGTETSPVVWRSYPGEKVLFTGGKAVTGFEHINDPAVLERIDKEYHDKILKTNLEAQGITNYGDINPAGGNRIELFFKNKFMAVARYPNEGWLRIADVPQTGKKRIHEGLSRDKSPVPRGRHYGRFTYDGDRPDRWAESEDIWVHGYWTWDWADQYLQVAGIDRKRHDLYPAEPHHPFGYTKNQRYYFLNILEELDAPGEWYLDRSSGILYFWPPSPIGESDAAVSIFEDVMVSFENTSHVTFSGITFECSRGSAVNISGGSNNTIAGCTFLNLGQTAVNINGGSDNGVLSCDIYDVASGGVDLHGGDYKTITPARHYAVNNHIHDYGIRLKTYQPAVEVTGVGNRVAHNLIHDAPHTGIFLVTSDVGNDHIIEFNELHSLAKETGDVGAIYLCARNYTFRGTVIRHNYLHHLFGPGLHGVMAVYLDDFTSGTVVYGNVFYKSGRSGFIGGGRDNIIENNIFVECEPSVHVDARGLGWASGSFADNNARFTTLIEDMNYTEPPYSEKYPELLTLLDDDPAVPKNNKIIRNVSFGGRWLDLDKKIPEGTVAFIDNLVDQDPGFVDPENEIFQLKEDSPAYKLGFKPIPIEEIGLYIDEYRKSLPENK